MDYQPESTEQPQAPSQWHEQPPPTEAAPGDLATPQPDVPAFSTAGELFAVGGFSAAPDGSIAPPGDPLDPGAPPSYPETPGQPGSPGSPQTPAPEPGAPEPDPSTPDITPSEPAPYAPDESGDGAVPNGGSWRVGEEVF